MGFGSSKFAAPIDSNDPFVFYKGVMTNAITNWYEHTDSWYATDFLSFNIAREESLSWNKIILLGKFCDDEMTNTFTSPSLYAPSGPGETNTFDIGTYWFCDEQVAFADLTFEFFDTSAETAAAGVLDWVSIDSTGTVTVAPSGNEFITYPLVTVQVGIRVIEN